MRTVDMVRRDIESTSRFLSELEEGIGALVAAGAPDLIEPEDVSKWNCILSKRDAQRERLDRLNAELLQYGNR